jgi:hypothetical protein
MGPRLAQVGRSLLVSALRVGERGQQEVGAACLESCLDQNKRLKRLGEMSSRVRQEALGQGYPAQDLMRPSHPQQKLDVRGDLQRPAHHLSSSSIQPPRR